MAELSLLKRVLAQLRRREPFSSSLQADWRQRGATEWSTSTDVKSMIEILSYVDHTRAVRTTAMCVRRVLDVIPRNRAEVSDVLDAAIVWSSARRPRLRTEVERALQTAQAQLAQYEAGTAQHEAIFAAINVGMSANDDTDPAVLSYPGVAIESATRAAVLGNVTVNFAPIVHAQAPWSNALHYAERATRPPTPIAPPAAPPATPVVPPPVESPEPPPARPAPPQRERPNPKAIFAGIALAVLVGVMVWKDRDW